MYEAQSYSKNPNMKNRKQIYLHAQKYNKK